MLVNERNNCFLCCLFVLIKVVLGCLNCVLSGLKEYQRYGNIDQNALVLITILIINYLLTAIALNHVLTVFNNSGNNNITNIELQLQ